MKYDESLQQGDPENEPTLDELQEHADDEWDAKAWAAEDRDDND